MENIKEKLVSLGFSNLETEVYLGLLQLGNAKAGELARTTNNSRSSVYSALETLKFKGIASETNKDGIKTFKPESLAVLTDFVTREEELLKKKKKTITEITPFLEKLNENRIEPTEAKVYQGKDGVMSALLQSLWYKPKKAYAITSVFGPEVTLHTKRRLEQKIPIELISPNTKDARERKKHDMEFNCKTYLLDFDKYKLPGSIYFTDREVILSTIDQPGVDIPVAVQIKDRDMATMFTELFGLLTKRF